MEEVDWDQGLPPDVLALVARAGGHHAMKAMRGVSKSWQEGFELGVTGIRIGFEDPLPLPWGKAAQRFPGLTSLDLGRSRADEERDLPALGSFPKLQKLFLGPWVELYLPGEYDHVGLSSRLTDAGMVHLRGLPLTQLGLNGCRAVSDLGMECLRGMPLRLLDLNGCTKVMDVGIEMLRGMRLEGLHLAGLFHLTPSALESLRGMPLARLNLFDGRLALSEGGLAASAQRASNYQPQLVNHNLLSRPNGAQPGPCLARNAPVSIESQQLVSTGRCGFKGFGEIAIEEPHSFWLL